VCLEPALEFEGELIGNGKKLRGSQNRVPDLSNQLEPFRDTQLADLGDISHP